MKGATHLYTYQCSFCHSLATTPVRMGRGVLTCQSCLRLMAYRWCEPIVTDAERSLAERGVVFHRPEPSTPRPTKVVRCRVSDCAAFKPEAEMVYLPGIGRFCSQEHAERGQREWDAFLERLRQLKEEKPWLEWHGTAP